jgi:hypothetical protein
MMVTMAASTKLFHAPITPQLVLAVTLVATSTFQYNLPKQLLRDYEDDAAASLETRKLIARSGDEIELSSEEDQGRTPIGSKAIIEGAPRA